MVVQLKRRDKQKQYARDHSPERKAARKLSKKRWKHARPDEAPFIAIDSEGFSFGDRVEHEGKYFHPHKTFLWGASDIEGPALWLHRQQAAPVEASLSSIEIMEWLLRLPSIFAKSAIFVSFSFSYDAAQIFADLPFEKLWELQRGRPWDNQTQRKNSRRIVLWRDYGFSYMKGKKLALYKFREGGGPYVETASGNRKLNTVAKILIYDVFGFFQSSFLKACKSMPGAVDASEYDTLFSGKGNRANFQPSDIEQVKPYTQVELTVLARMMTKLREAMIGEDIHVRQWFGAGSIAQALLKRENIKEQFSEVRTREICDPQLWAHCAYFGGRIELLRQGATAKTLYGYDIASAYPFIATTLPSQRFGEWHFIANPNYEQIRRASLLSLIHLKTHNFPVAPFYPLPYRTPKGSILFPRSVHGFYCQEEVCAAYEWIDRFGKGEIEAIGMWEFDVRSTVKPFAFLQKLFDYRATLKKEDITQIVVKLGINSCYGKLAQAVSGGDDKPPVFANPWYAAAITAGTRARLLKAALLTPKSIVMLATDGIISTSPLPLEIPKTKTLGGWEAGELARGGVFIQSGVYTISDETGKDASKSRGFRPTNMAGSPEDMMRLIIPGLWAQDRIGMDFKYQSYMTLGASVASRELAPFIGMWVDGVRKLDLRGAGIKRNVSDSGPTRRRRAKGLVATEPNNSNAVLIDANGDMLPSTAFMPEWLDPEIGEQAANDEENEQIHLARFS